MTEREWWSGKVRPALHRPEQGFLALKQQDAFLKGMPDALLCARGQVLQLELKLRAPISPLPPKAGPYNLGLSAEQRLLLKQWYAAGGRSGVLTGTSDGLALYTGWRLVEAAWSLETLLELGRLYRWKGVGPEPALELLQVDLALGNLDAASALPARP